MADACNDPVAFRYLYPLSIKLRDRVELIAREIYGAAGVGGLPIRDVRIYSGAKFLCPLAGDISLMPGTSSNPGFRRVGVDVKTGKVTGLF